MSGDAWSDETQEPARSRLAESARGIYGRGENVSEPTICDGCNVRPPFEHRCHAAEVARTMTVGGVSRYARCQCAECREAAEMFPRKCSCGARKILSADEAYLYCPRCPMSGQY